MRKEDIFTDEQYSWCKKLCIIFNSDTLIVDGMEIKLPLEKFIREKNSCTLG